MQWVHGVALKLPMRKLIDLQAVREDLVHLGDARGDGEVDGAVADLDDEAADNVRVDLVGDLELLAGANVRGLADGGLELGEGLVIEGLGRGDSHLDLTARRRDDLVELVADALEEAKTVVLSERLEEVLDGGAAATGLLDKLGNNGRLVLGAQGRGGENAVELGVLVGNGAERGEGLGGWVESRRLGGSSVLQLFPVS